MHTSLLCYIIRIKVFYNMWLCFIYLGMQAKWKRETVTFIFRKDMISEGLQSKLTIQYIPLQTVHVTYVDIKWVVLIFTLILSRSDLLLLCILVFIN
jgi:hypothetical protein